MKISKKEKKIAKKLVKLLNSTNDEDLEAIVEIGMEEKAEPDVVLLFLMEKQYRNLTLEGIC